MKSVSLKLHNLLNKVEQHFGNLCIEMSVEGEARDVWHEFQEYFHGLKARPKSAPARRKLTDRQFAAVLVGLRLCQEHDEDLKTFPQFEGLRPLTVKELEALAQALNCGKVRL